MPANGRWDLIRRLKVNLRENLKSEGYEMEPRSENLSRCVISYLFICVFIYLFIYLFTFVCFVALIPLES